MARKRATTKTNVQDLDDLDAESSVETEESAPSIDSEVFVCLDEETLLGLL